MVTEPMVITSLSAMVALSLLVAYMLPPEQAVTLTPITAARQSAASFSAFLIFTAVPSLPVSATGRLILWMLPQPVCLPLNWSNAMVGLPTGTLLQQKNHVPLEKSLILRRVASLLFRGHVSRATCVIVMHHHIAESI